MSTQKYTQLAREIDRVDAEKLQTFLKSVRPHSSQVRAETPDVIVPTKTSTTATNNRKATEESVDASAPKKHRPTRETPQWRKRLPSSGILGRLVNYIEAY
jgi:hypothetical protein